MSYDLVVVGLGAMGSATLDSAAGRGLHVLGIEQFAPGHALGSSHGKSRMIRKAYFEDAAYVPLVLRAYELWHDLERRSGRTLLRRTGVLQVGLENSAVVCGVQRSAEMHGLAIDVLAAKDVRRRYPMTRPLPQEVGVFEHDGGVLAPELALATQIALAIEAGAETRFNERVMRWMREPQSLRIELASGEVVRARKLALCTGPWPDARAPARVPIRVQRKVQVWFEPASDAFDVVRCPAFLVERAAFGETLYGFPDLGDGVKAAFHTGGAIVTMETLDRSIRDADVLPLQAALQTWMPGAGERVSTASVCQYAMTPDEHFILGFHPHEPSVVVAAGFSGHGFKFSPAIGEAIVDLAIDGVTACDIDFLAPDRVLSSSFFTPQ